jgi:hypothetical protein
MRIGHLADRLDAAADRLAAGGAELADVDPGAAAFGADSPGRLGELGRLLHGRWSSALTDRSREAAVAGARLSDSADALRVAVGRYQDADATAQARQDLETY